MKTNQKRLGAALLAFLLLIGLLPVSNTMADVWEKEVTVKLELDTEETVWLSGEEDGLEITGSSSSDNHYVT